MTAILANIIECAINKFYSFTAFFIFSIAFSNILSHILPLIDDYIFGKIESKHLNNFSLMLYALCIWETFQKFKVG